MSVDLILGRVERPVNVEEPLARLLDQRVLVTGANGSIGQALVDRLRLAGVDVRGADLDDADVRDEREVFSLFNRTAPTVVIHLAGDKYATSAEVVPFEVAETNIIGTRNVLAAAARAHAHVVVASTCKACDPETAYGASKLIAERMALQAGHSVARFVNVVETQGNVFGLWGALPAGEPLPVADCERYFMSLNEAVALLVWSAVLPAGRYTVDVGVRRSMLDVARDLYPGRAVRRVNARRGDRLVEPPAVARCESATRLPCGLVRVTSPHDPMPTVIPQVVAA